MEQAPQLAHPPYHLPFPSSAWLKDVPDNQSGIQAGLWEGKTSRTQSQNNKKRLQLVFLINSPHLAIRKDGLGWYNPGLTHAADTNVTALQPCKANQTCT